jgi:hypothetical protein
MQRVQSALVFVTLAGLGACSSSASRSAPDSGSDAAIEDGGVGQDSAGLDARPSGDGSGAASDTGPGEDTGAMGDAGFVEAHHGAFPQVPNNGGPTLASPQLVTITFAGYSEASTISSFGDWIVTSDWLTTVGKDYGVGHGTHVQSVVLPGPAPAMASDLDTQALLEQNLMSGVLPSAPLDAGAGDGGTGGYLYMIVYPSTTTTGSFLGGADSCTYLGGGSFIGGYHWETQSGPYHVPYAVIPTCTSSGMVEGAADLETSASHEFIEASTDPFPNTNTAWAIIDPNNPWISTDGEVADMCEGKITSEAGFSPQRIWSNTAAMGTGDPCVPALASEILYDVSATPTTTQSVAAGMSVTYTLTGFSSGPIMPWTLQASAGGSFTPTFNLSSMTMNNGQTATLTVTVPAGTASQSYASVFITSYFSFTDFNEWVVAVTVP